MKWLIDYDQEHYQIINLETVCYIQRWNKDTIQFKYEAEVSAYWKFKSEEERNKEFDKIQHMLTAAKKQ